MQQDSDGAKLAQESNGSKSAQTSAGSKLARTSDGSKLARTSKGPKMVRASRVPNNVYMEDQFWEVFPSDIDRPDCYRILLSCGYVSLFRLARLIPTFETLIARGVRICTFIQKPWYWDKDSNTLSRQDQQWKAEVATVMNTLLKMNVHFNWRLDEHQKVAIIGEKILWDGSLNMMSHVKKKERMRRYESTIEVQRALVDHDLLNCEECIARSPLCATTLSDAEVISYVVSQLIARRKFLGLTQGELADLAKLSQSNLSRIENGRAKDINLSTMMALARILGLAPVLVAKINAPCLSSVAQSTEFEG